MVDSVSFSEKQLLWAIFTVLFLAAFFGVVTYLVFVSRGQTDGVFNGVYERIYETRLLNSPMCFAYKDSVSGRTYTGVIDITKFNQKTLTNCTQLRSASEEAMLVELVYLDANRVRQLINLRTLNWDYKTSMNNIEVRSYPVNVHGNGPGLIRFTHIK